MKKIAAAVTALASLLVIGCQQQTTETTSPQIWFDGTLDQALRLAEERDTLIMLDFYSHT